MSAEDRFTLKEKAILKRAADAARSKQQGQQSTGRTQAPQYDAKGQLLNPYIPVFIAKAPWYATASASVGESTAAAAPSDPVHHQRLAARPHASLDDHRVRVKAEVAARQYRPGACTNCGAMGHQAKGCMERPRKRGAKWDGGDDGDDGDNGNDKDDAAGQPPRRRGMALDAEVREPAVPLGFEGKRDRWAGYEVDEGQVEETLRKWHEQQRPDQSGKGPKSDSDDNNSDDSDDNSDDSDREVVPATGSTAVEKGLRGTLRIREDTAKYLEDFSEAAPLYDPKTRSMRRSATASSTGASFVPAVTARMTTTTTTVGKEEEVFCWDVERRTTMASGVSGKEKESSDLEDCTNL